MNICELYEVSCDAEKTKHFFWLFTKLSSEFKIEKEFSQSFVTFVHFYKEELGTKKNSGTKIGQKNSICFYVWRKFVGNSSEIFAFKCIFYLSDSIINVFFPWWQITRISTALNFKVIYKNDNFTPGKQQKQKLNFYIFVILWDANRKQIKNFQK